MSDKKGSSENNEKQKINRSSSDKSEHTKEAHEQAEKDIAKDPDFIPGENEDLDEGELAKKEGHP